MLTPTRLKNLPKHRRHQNLTLSGNTKIIIVTFILKTIIHLPLWLSRRRNKFRRIEHLLAQARRKPTEYENSREETPSILDLSNAKTVRRIVLKFLYDVECPIYNNFCYRIYLLKRQLSFVFDHFQKLTLKIIR